MGTREARRVTPEHSSNRLLPTAHIVKWATFCGQTIRDRD